MRGLLAAVIGMGVLIVIGVTVLVMTMVSRMSAPAAPIASPVSAASRATLEEPTGTRIASATVAGDRVALVLAGGGGDRVVVLDVRTGRELARIGLAP